MKLFDTHVRDDIWNSDSRVIVKLKDSVENVVMLEYRGCYITWISSLWSIVKDRSYENL